jgi:hypothetical protein
MFDVAAWNQTPDAGVDFFRAQHGDDAEGIDAKLGGVGPSLERCFPGIHFELVGRMLVVEASMSRAQKAYSRDIYAQDQCGSAA